MTKRERAFEMGRQTALSCYLKTKGVSNPYSIETLAKEWRRGWLEGCDEVLASLRQQGKCIDVPFKGTK